MPDSIERIQVIEIVFAVEGHDRPLTLPSHREMTVAEFLSAVTAHSGLSGLTDVFWENAEEPLAHSLCLAQHLPASFSPLHVATRGKIATTIEFNNRKAERSFRANATIAHIIVWAIGPHGLKLEGKPEDFQIKHAGKVIPPTTHLGQITQGKKAIHLHLVFRVKPQGGFNGA